MLDVLPFLPRKTTLMSFTALLHTKPLLKRSLLNKERICQKLFSDRADPFSEGDKGYFDDSPLSVSIHLNSI